jgi:hypothetical protein
MKLRLLATVILSVALVAILLSWLWSVDTIVNPEVPQPGWVAPIEKEPSTEPSSWLRFKQALVRHDTQEVNHWIGQRVSFVAESNISPDHSLVVVRRIYEGDPEWTKLTANLDAAVRSRDWTQIKAGTSVFEAYDRQFPRITCKFPLASAKVIFRYEFGFTTFEIEGIIREVDLKTNRIWVDPLSFMPAAVSS